MHKGPSPCREWPFCSCFCGNPLQWRRRHGHSRIWFTMLEEEMVRTTTESTLQTWIGSIPFPPSPLSPSLPIRPHHLLIELKQGLGLSSLELFTRPLLKDPLGKIHFSPLRASTECRVVQPGFGGLPLMVKNLGSRSDTWLCLTAELYVGSLTSLSKAEFRSLELGCQIKYSRTLG